MQTVHNAHNRYFSLLPKCRRNGKFVQGIAFCQRYTLVADENVTLKDFSFRRFFISRKMSTAWACFCHSFLIHHSHDANEKYKQTGMLFRASQKGTLVFAVPFKFIAYCSICWRSCISCILWIVVFTKVV